MLCATAHKSRVLRELIPFVFLAGEGINQSDGETGRYTSLDTLFTLTFNNVGHWMDRGLGAIFFALMFTQRHAFNASSSTLVQHQLFWILKVRK